MMGRIILCKNVYDFVQGSLARLCMSLQTAFTGVLYDTVTKEAKRVLEQLIRR